MFATNNSSSSLITEPNLYNKVNSNSRILAYLFQQGGAFASIHGGTRCHRRSNSWISTLFLQPTPKCHPSHKVDISEATCSPNVFRDPRDLNANAEDTASWPFHPKHLAMKINRLNTVVVCDCAVHNQPIFCACHNR